MQQKGQSTAISDPRLASERPLAGAANPAAIKGYWTDVGDRFSSLLVMSARQMTGSRKWEEIFALWTRRELEPLMLSCAKPGREHDGEREMAREVEVEIIKPLLLYISAWNGIYPRCHFVNAVSMSLCPFVFF